MILFRSLLVVVAAGCLLLPVSLKADAPPFTPSKQFSTDQVMTVGQGITATGRLYFDNGKARAETSINGMSVVSIIRPDQQKIYSVMPSMKKVMIMPLDAKMAAQITAAEGDDGKFETVGPDSVEGTACVKYKMTTKDGKVFFWWVNPATKTPMKITAADGSYTVTMKNYVVGPQAAALFEPPADFEVVDMPSIPGLTGGGGQ